MAGNGDISRRTANTGRLKRPENRKELQHWVSTWLGMYMPLAAQCAHHQTPLDYLEHSFFEKEQSDAIIWACRGGGKTMIGAAATLLDLLFKPGVQVRILGGSMEQSEKMYAYLMRLVRRQFHDQLAATPTQRGLALVNGSQVQVLAQSDQSVRGQRVQKLRCDEVELFDPRVWQAAQLTTRSTGQIRGTVEAFSTMHKPNGLMQNLLAQDRAGRRVFAWCLWDVIQQCPPQLPCETCELWDACQGRAKHASGFLNVHDAMAMRSRVSQATWDHEMLCLPPKLENAVFYAFDRKKHLRSLASTSLVSGQSVIVDERSLRMEQLVCGVDFGYRDAFVCLWVAMLREAGKRVVWVVDELVTQQQTLAKNVAAMRARQWQTNRVYCDIAGTHVNSHSGINDIRILKEAGFDTTFRSMQIMDGIGALRDLLDPAEGPPRLLIDPRCVRLLAAMEGYASDPNGKPVKDKYHDHPIDALRYAVMNHDQTLSKMERRLY